MSFLSFDEKAWDKVRPSSIKKTGVSEAIRAFEKALPKGVEELKTSAACSTAVELLDTVADKLSTAKTRFDKNKHDDAIKKVTGWLSEIAVRRKIITNRSDKLHELYEQQIMQANAALDPYIEKAEAAVTTARKLASAVSDKAKEALLAASNGNSTALADCQSQAAKLKTSLNLLLDETRNLYREAEKACQSKMPPEDVLDQGHKNTIKSVSVRCSNIHVTVKEKVGFFAEQFQESLETITAAGTRGDGLQAKFAKLISSDIEALEMLAAPLQKGPPAILIDLEQATDRLKSALKNTDTKDKARQLEEAGKWAADAIKKVASLQAVVKKLDKHIESKLKSYPPFFTEEKERFKRQHQGFQDLRDYQVKSSEQVEKLLEQATALASQIVKAKEK